MENAKHAASTAESSSKKLPQVNFKSGLSAVTINRKVSTVYKFVWLMKNRSHPLRIDSLTLTYCQSHYANISPWFLFYKYAHAFAILSLLCLNMSHLRYAKTDPLRWHLYISHWSTLICAIEAICGVFTVNYFFHHCHTKSQRDAVTLSDGMTRQLLCYIYLNATAQTFASTASVLFWVFMNNSLVPKLKAIEHTVIPAFMLIKLLVERTPYQISHVFYPLVYLVCYFADVIIMYLTFYDSLYSSKGSFLFNHFDERSGVFVLIWFFLKSSLILAAIHVLLVLVSLSRVFFLRFKCFRRRRPLGLAMSTIAVRSDSACSADEESCALQRQTVQMLKATLREHPVKSLIDLIKASETYCRQDFIHAEWSYSSERPKIRYLLYRFLHLLLFVTIILFSLCQPTKTGTEKETSVKDVLMWIFYMANFFLCVSMFQAILGFCVILNSFITARGDLKYYEKSDYYITGFQKSYCAINSAATALALFVLCTSLWLSDDSGSSLSNLHISYDSSHVLNPLAMSLDFLLVAHPYKMVHIFLCLGILAMNVIFNYWLYVSQITSRTGKKFIYEFLNWDDNAQSIMHTALLFLVLACIHFSIWCLFLLKRYFSVALHRRELTVLLRRMSTINGSPSSYKYNGLHQAKNFITLHCLGDPASFKKFLIEAILLKSASYINLSSEKKSAEVLPDASNESIIDSLRQMTDDEFTKTGVTLASEPSTTPRISVNFSENDESEMKSQKYK